MAKYLFRANYVGEGIKGLLSEGGTSRRQEVERLFSAVGGTVESFYYAFGETDAYIIGEFPDHESVAALAMTVAASGRVTVTSTVLLTPEEIDAAVKISPAYRAPGA